MLNSPPFSKRNNGLELSDLASPSTSRSQSSPTSYTSSIASKSSGSALIHSKVEEVAYPKNGITEEIYQKSTDGTRLRSCWPCTFGSKTAPPVPEERAVCPEFSSNWFSRTTYSWIQPLLSVGRRRSLEPNDIWLVNPERGLETLSHKFRASFHRRHQHKHALAFALYDTFTREFWIGGFWQLTASLCQVGIPLVLRFLLSFVTDRYQAADARSEGNLKESPPLGRGLGLVVGLLLLQFVQGIGITQFSYHVFMIGAQARGVLVAAIFDKFTKLSGQLRKDRGPSAKGEGNSAPDGLPLKKEAGPGQRQKVGKRSEGAESVINLMSSDINYIYQAVGAIHLVWTAPITIVLAIAIVLDTLSYSAIPGVFLLMFGVSGLTLSVKWIGKLQPVLRKFTNARVSLTQEVLRHISFVKYNALEQHFLNELKRRRTRELGIISKILNVRNLMYTVSTCLPVFATVVSLVVYSVTGHQLTASTAFSSVVVFNTLRVPFASMSVSMRQVADGWAALERLQNFLVSEEPKEDAVRDMDSESAISVKQGMFAWEMSSDSGSAGEAQEPNGNEIQRGIFSLTDINLSIARGELVAVVGATGSGKTSLLSALAGQMPKTGGEVTIGVASRAICAQNAWIQSASLKDNILFGKPMDRRFYNRTIESCALAVDIKALPAGDGTEVGERGAGLSGGQRQRINLARAVYADSDLVLLDDPLSAVDANVGQHLFEEVICGDLKGKTRILVTHQREFFSQCDKIVWMENGRIRAMDTYSNLLSAEADFRAMLATTVRTKNEANQKERIVRKNLTLNQTGDDNQENPASSDKTVAEEISNGARGSLNILNRYIRSSGHFLNGSIPAVLLVLAQGAGTLTSLWVSYWISNKFSPLSRNQYITVYVTLAVAQAVLTFGLAGSLSMLGNRASRSLLEKAIHRVVGAPMSFHDLKPLGLTVDLFLQDTEAVDQRLPELLCAFLFSIAALAGACVVVEYYFHWFVAALFPLSLVFVCVAAYYNPTAKQLRRFETSTRGKMFSLFSEFVSGIQTIKACGMHPYFSQKLGEAIDNMNATAFLVTGIQQWLTIRLNLIALFMVMSVGFLAVFSGEETQPSITGVVLSSVLAFRIQIQLLLQQLGELEGCIHSTGRLFQYCTQAQNDVRNQGLIESSHLASISATEVPQSWPARGDISMINIKMCYRPELPMVLKGLDINIQGGEKIGIVGRTGAGKSSLATALFRFVELSGGSITIDGLDIKRVPVNVLRTRMSIVSQHPVLFQGTIRSNLDPHGQHTEVELWDALYKAGMYNRNAWLDPDAEVQEGGANYSQGQCQLLAIARVLLRNTRIVICDESTSSIDSETEAKVQEVMRKAFANKTVLTIAHRLPTILGCDRICVLEQGRIAELDTPIRLWERHGIFRNMCDQVGIEREDFGATPSG